MQEPTNGATTTGSGQPARAVRAGVTQIWPILAGFAFGSAVGAISVRLIAGPWFDGLLIFAAGVALALLAFWFQVRNRASET